MEVDCGEYVHAKMVSNMDSNEASVVGFFGGVVAIGGSDWFDGLCVCGSVDGLMVCVCVCVCVCVVMGLDRWIGVSWVCVCVWLCVLKPVLEVGGEREEKE